MRIRLVCRSAVFAALFYVGCSAASEGGEVPLVDVVPKPLIGLDGIVIEDPVDNDGRFNRYLVHSNYGNFEVDGTLALCKLVREIKAIEQISALESTEAFSDAAVEAARNLGTGAKNLVTRPTETIGAAVQGLGRVFGRVGNRVVRGDESSEAEDSGLESIIGFSKVKRDYAYDFGVDVYSDNEVLQQYLDQLAWTGFSGSVAFNITAVAATGGLAGAALSVSNYSYALEQLIRDSSPADLRANTREALLGQGVDSTLVDLFIRNSALSPRHQTFIAGALATMENVAGRELILRNAADATSHAEGFERQVQAQLYARIHSMQPLARIVAVGPHIVAESVDGTVVVAATADYLRWTDDVAELFADGNRSLDDAAFGAERALWLLHDASPEARASLSELGWTLHAGLLEELEVGRCDPNVADLTLVDA